MQVRNALPVLLSCAIVAVLKSKIPIMHDYQNVSVHAGHCFCKQNVDHNGLMSSLWVNKAKLNTTKSKLGNCRQPTKQQHAAVTSADPTPLARAIEQQSLVKKNYFYWWYNLISIGASFLPPV